MNLLVDDVDRACRALSARGARIAKGPEDTPWGGRIAVFPDPDGNTIQLNQIDWRGYSPPARDEKSGP